MRKTLLATALAAALFSPAAAAADLPFAYKAPQTTVVAVPDWTGFYLGLNGGYGWGNASLDPAFTATGLAATPLFSPPTPAGWLVGGHAGYNWQYGAFVGGLEVDYDGADINASQTVTPPGARGVSATLTTKIDQLASVRGRVGVSPMSGLLLYATAGLAYGHTAATVSATNGAATITENAFANNFGWVAGGGAEFKVLQNVTLGAEYLHYDFGEANYSFVTPILNTNSKVTVDTARLRIGYKF